MYTLYKFHFLNGISEINQLFDDILIIWPAPVYTQYNLIAHSSCTSLLILLFIKSTVYYIAHFILLNILLFILFYFLPIFIYILLCCVTYVVLSIEWTWPDLHFTMDYILYNWVCDE